MATATSAFYDVLEKDLHGNVLRGDVIAESCRGCYVSATGRQVAVIGMKSCVVVATEDAVLVMSPGSSQTRKMSFTSPLKPSADMLRAAAVPLQQLKSLGEMLVDIHGQQIHQSLGRRPVQTVCRAQGVLRDARTRARSGVLRPPY